MRKQLRCFVVAIALVSTLANGAVLRRRTEVDNPSSTNFIRRSYAAATVIGNFVYVDGGEVSQVIDGNQPAVDNPSKPGQSSLWNLSGQNAVNSIPKLAPLFNSQAIWTDNSSNSFWIWGGEAPTGTGVPKDSQWQFTADGNGGGSWAEESPSNSRLFNELVRPTGCAYTQGQGVGYCLGGLVTSRSDKSSSTTDFAIPGLVTFGMKSSIWTNTSTSGFGKFGTLAYGAAEFVPFGPNGLIMLMGGAEGPITTFDSDFTDVNFANVTFWDPISRLWFSQATTGTRPNGRQRFCSVGVQGPQNTYEIFIYGGVSADDKTMASNEVFVLSLPGFVFAKADAAGTARADHACVIVGNGKRQMLSIGGTNAAKGYPASFTDPDPWAQGLGVFDMTSMQWTGGYDAAAVAYDTPEVVKQFYRNGGLGKVVWANDNVKRIFSTATPNFGSTPTNTGSTTTGTSSPTSTTRSNPSGTAGSNPSTTTNSGSPSNSVSATASGTPQSSDSSTPGTSGQSSSGTLSRGAVLGISLGVSGFVIALLTGFFICLYRPRRRNRTPSPDNDRSKAASRSPPITNPGVIHTPTSVATITRYLSSDSPGALRPPTSSRIVNDPYPSPHLSVVSGMTHSTAPLPPDEAGYSVTINGIATPFGTAVSKGPSSPVVVRPLGSNPVKMHSDLASRRGQPALQAIRTRPVKDNEKNDGGFGGAMGFFKKGRIRIYQDKPPTE